MAKTPKAKQESNFSEPNSMRNHPHGSLTVPENKLVGGEPIFGSDQGLNIASPNLSVPPGQTTYE